MKIVLLVLVQCMTILGVVGLCRNDCKKERPLYDAIPCVSTPKCHDAKCSRAYVCDYINNWPKDKCYLNKTYYNNGDIFPVNYYDKTTKTVKSCLHVCATAYTWKALIPLNCPSTDIADFNAAAQVCTDNVRYDQQFIANYDLPIYISVNHTCPLSWLSETLAPPSNTMNRNERTCRAGESKNYEKNTFMIIFRGNYVFKCLCECPPFLYCSILIYIYT